MKPCTILDLQEIYEIISESEGESDVLFESLRNSVLMKDSNVFFRTDDSVMIYQYLGNGKWIVHVHSATRAHRGLALRDFAVRTGRWMIDNKQAKTFLNFVPISRLDLRFFMKMIGSQKVGEIPGTSEILYASTEAMGIRE
jgi:hypothetical protein